MKDSIALSFAKTYPFTHKCLNNWRLYLPQHAARRDKLYRLAMCTILIMSLDEIEDLQRSASSRLKNLYLRLVK